MLNEENENVSVMNDDSQTNKQQSSSQLNESGSDPRSIREQLKQSEKDRTLFCINIDQKCSEKILFELFLQVYKIDLIFNFFYLFMLCLKTMLKSVFDIFNMDRYTKIPRLDRIDRLST
jgi:RNA recognition motif-containing protein